MKLQNKYKIALVGYRLSGGGAPKVMANLSCFLYDIGVDVHIITVIDEYGYPYKGKVIATEKLKVGSGVFNRVSRFIALKRLFQKEKYDYIIDFRFKNKKVQEYFIANFLYNSPTIFTVHSSALEQYIPKSKFWAKIIHEKSFAIVSVSNYIVKSIKEQYNFKNVLTIYNTIDIEKINDLKNEITDNNFPDGYVLGVGQIETNVKQFDHLIKAYSKSKLDIPLLICGEGVLQEQLVKLSEELGVSEKVFFLGFQENPFKFMKNAKFLVVSSAFEGFSNVLIEALSCDTPVISYDCVCGPNEIINHEYNGLLVKNQDIDALSEAMIRFSNENELYTICKSNARKSVEKFFLNEIGRQWVKLMKLE